MKEPKVIYRDSDHTYKIDGVRAVSGTQAIGKYHDNFDSDYWSYNEALKRLLPDIKELRKEILKAEGLYKYPYFIKPPRELVFPSLTFVAGGEEVVKEMQQNVLKEYEEASLKGTECHLLMEKASIERGYEVNPWSKKEYPVINPQKKYDNESIKDNLYDLEDGYYPELLVWDCDLQLHDENGEPLRNKKDIPYKPGIAGQADKVFIETIGGIRYIDIDDYKFTKKKPTNVKFLDNMKGPLSHLFDNSYNKYNLQSTLYAGILQRAGFTVRNLAITHYKDHDITKGERIDFEFLEKEFNSIFNL